MSLLLTVPNDDSGILSVIPSAPFISKAVRATGSLLVSFAGGDTACPVRTTHRDPAWTALQHGVSAAFVVESVDEGATMPFMQKGFWILHTVSSSSVSQLRRDQPDDFNGYGYFCVRLCCTCLGFQANIAEE